MHRDRVSLRWASAWGIASRRDGSATASEEPRGWQHRDNLAGLVPARQLPCVALNHTGWMTTNNNDPLSAADVRDGRRWLIGLGISLAFGLFGVVMALLAYSERTKASAPPTARVPTRPVPVVEPERDLRRKRDRHK